MKTPAGIAAAWLAALLCVTAAQAQSLPRVLSLSLNRPTFTGGDVLGLTLINTNAVPGTGDLYLVAQSSSGALYAFDGTQWRLFFDGVNLVPAGLRAFRTNSAVTTSNELLLNVTLPSPLAPGVYTAYAVLVAPSGNPLDAANWRSNLAEASFGYADATPGGSRFLSADDVRAILRRAAESLDATTMVIAVTDRGGNVLGLFAKPDAPSTVNGNFGQRVAADDFAVSLARTGAFFSNDQAPLSSRTVRYISGIHFPPGIRNKPNAALYGIENTNRGCALNTVFNPGQAVVPSRSIHGGACHSFDVSGCGLGIATGKADVFDSDPGAVNGGGVPIFKDGALVGGIGVTGVDPASAEFAAFAGSVPDERFGPRPAAPGVIFLDGLQLPFVSQTTPPSGPGAFAGRFVLGPLDSPFGADGVPDGWLVGPFASADLSASDVETIVGQSVAVASQARAAIRLPLGSRTRMVIAVTDLPGAILGLFRMPDSAVFSIDVAVAKARNMVFFNGPDRLAQDLPGVPPATAVTNRTISFGAQPLYPPGIDGTGPGPFFSLYLDDVNAPCRQGSQPRDLNQIGVVFFPGSMPLVRNGRLVGGLGISGDGVEQDDLVAAAGATGFVPPEAVRADQLVVGGVRLPFLKFPRNPFE